jgi:dihydropteroate synthase
MIKMAAHCLQHGPPSADFAFRSTIQSCHVPRDHIHFVTGRLAEYSLRNVLAELAPRAGFDYSIDVLPITVAALMTPEWIARRIVVPPAATRVLLPGYCHGDLQPVAAAARVPVERGPKDLRELPRLFGHSQTVDEEYGRHDIQILAEINHCPRLSRAEILAQAAALSADGAEVIDVGCDPGDAWPGVADTVRALRDAGHRVSIDSLNPDEIGPAVRAGAELVLSVNSSNRDRAADWGCEVVVVPDVPQTLAGLDDTVEFLAAARVPLRIDPVLEPIGFGFARSLARYLAVRDRYPDAEVLMGVGNLTELTDADSAAVNVLLLGFCEELGIRSVLTTQVIPWAASSVRECDLARRLVYYAVKRRSLPKHVEPRLVMLRDAAVFEHGPEGLERLAREIKDHNYRLFAEGGQLHVIAAGLHVRGNDPFELFEQLQASGMKNLDPAHAFYLGHELAKAVTALTLGKQYRQDEALDWGFLTTAEQSHRERKAKKQAPAATQ